MIVRGHGGFIEKNERRDRVLVADVSAIVVRRTSGAILLQRPQTFF